MNKLIMNKLIITIALMALSQMALSQMAMGGERDTLEKAQEVAQRMRDAADSEYAEGVAERNELQHWEDSTAALARVQAKHDQHDEIMLAANEAHRLKVANSLPFVCELSRLCRDHIRAGAHWRWMRAQTKPHLVIAKARIKLTGTTMVTELDRAKEHLEWAEMEKENGLRMLFTIGHDYETTEYNDEVDTAIRTGWAAVEWAKQSLEKATARVSPLTDEALEAARQEKYKAADAYFDAKKAFLDTMKSISKEAIRRADDRQTEYQQFLLWGLYGEHLMDVILDNDELMELNWEKYGI